MVITIVAIPMDIGVRLFIPGSTRFLTEWAQHDICKTILSGVITGAKTQYFETMIADSNYTIVCDLCFYRLSNVYFF
jgi:hypothetical protein